MGRQKVRRELVREFWLLIGQGLSSEAAGARVGFGGTSARKFFRKAGGVPPLDLAEPQGRYLSFAERETVMVMRAQGSSMRAIARELGRSPSTISRELERNTPTRAPYRASTAHGRAEDRSRRAKATKLAGNDRLRAQVQALSLIHI